MISIDKPSNNNQDIEINHEKNIEITNFVENNKLKEVILIFWL
jgi:hypothetical protein